MTVSAGLLGWKVFAGCENVRAERTRISLPYIRATNKPVHGAHPTKTYMFFVTFMVQSCRRFLHSEPRVVTAHRFAKLRRDREQGNLQRRLGMIDV
jgi:hypothetical protein